MKTDIKFYQNTQEIKVVTRNAANKINELLHYDSIVKGNKVYKLPSDLPGVTDEMCRKLVYYLVMEQTDLCVKVEYRSLTEDK